MLWCAALALSGCITPNSQFDAIAADHELQKTQLTGTAFQHILYATQRPRTGSTLHAYFGSDGTPWLRDRPSDDPSPRVPLTIQLMLQDDASSVYVGRPCYHGFAKSPGCNSPLWTSGRYSEAIVSSMAAVTSAYAERHGYSAVVLIGYSGGGVLATLVAPHLKDLKGLITVAANLDIDAWADYHGYEPLDSSLNPAGIEEFDIRAKQIHFYGADDKVVAPVTADRFFDRNPSATREIVPDFDHVCCWIASWPVILDRALKNLESSY